MESSFGDGITQTIAALKRSETFLAMVERLSCTGSFEWQVHADVMTWSDELYRIFGVARGAPASLPLMFTRVHPDDALALRHRLEQARRDGGNIELEHRLLMPDGSIRHLRMVARCNRHPGGPRHCLGAIQDVTQQRMTDAALTRAKSELAHAARVMCLGALTASIAHEVSQPLSGIITNSGTCLRMLNCDPPDVEGARESVRRTLRDGSRAIEVIRRLRTLFGKRGSRIESVDLNDATAEVIALSLGELQRKRIVVRTELADDLPAVSGDRVQLQQVMLNLLLNACDAMAKVADRARQLLIRTERDATRFVRWSVRDCGVGLPPEEALTLFEPFHTTKCDGMGIGLFVSRSIIESHQGRLQVEINEGPGVTFFFLVPCRVPRPLDFMRRARLAPPHRAAP